MPAELLLATGKIAMQKLVGEAIKRAGPPLIAELRQVIRDWRKTEHPSLKDLRTICDWLEPFRLNTQGGGVGRGPAAKYDFSRLPPEHFHEKDMAIDEVAQLWFRTDTDLWRMKIEPVISRWAELSPSGRMPYFRGDVDFDYGAVREPQMSRHPIFRSVHPFIMLSQLPRTKLGDNPVAEVTEFYLDGWDTFVVPDYTTFKLGTAVKLDSQAYVEGYFEIAPKSQCRIGKDVIGTEVTMWRCVMVTASAHVVEIMNVGIPASPNHGAEYVGHFYKWMEKFREAAGRGHAIERMLDSP